MLPLVYAVWNFADQCWVYCDQFYMDYAYLMALGVVNNQQITS